MGIELTEEEMRRIEQFAKTPAYERTPETLVPDGGETE
jgi:hypothetical protein